MPSLECCRNINTKSTSWLIRASEMSIRLPELGFHTAQRIPAKNAQWVAALHMRELPCVMMSSHRLLECYFKMSSLSFIFFLKTAHKELLRGDNGGSFSYWIIPAFFLCLPSWVISDIT